MPLEMQEIFDNVISQTYHNELTSKKCNINAESY